MILTDHLKAAWRYRNFIFTSVKGEFEARFARSRLGTAWHVLNPLAMAAIYSLVLSKVLSARLPGAQSESLFAIYLISGIAAWGLFSEITTRSLTIFIEYSNTMKKISFPRIALPLIVVGSALVNHLLLLIAALVVFSFLGHVPSVTWAALPLGICLISILALGLGVLLGVLNVFVRDIAQVMSVVLQLWFWLTPIVYPRDIVPSDLQWIAVVNPLTPIVGLYQDALVFHRWPNMETLIYPVALSILLACLSMFVFHQASPELVDEL